MIVVTVQRNSLKYTALEITLSRSKMIRRLVLDVLKPHNPSVVELSEALSHLKGVEGVNVIIYDRPTSRKRKSYHCWKQHRL